MLKIINFIFYLLILICFKRVFAEGVCPLGAVSAIMVEAEGERNDLDPLKWGVIPIEIADSISRLTSTPFKYEFGGLQRYLDFFSEESSLGYSPRFSVGSSDGFVSVTEADIIRTRANLLPQLKILLNDTNIMFKLYPASDEEVVFFESPLFANRGEIVLSQILNRFGEKIRIAVRELMENHGYDRKDILTPVFFKDKNSVGELLDESHPLYYARNLSPSDPLYGLDVNKQFRNG